MTRPSLNRAFESRTRRDPGFCPLGFDPWGSPRGYRSSRRERGRGLRSTGRGDSRRSLAAAFLGRRVSERAAVTDRLLGAADEIREHRERPPWCVPRYACRSRPCRPFEACRSVIADPRVATQGVTRVRTGTERATLPPTSINRSQTPPRLTDRATNGIAHTNVRDGRDRQSIG
jgi:hypothetical protein